ncbi:MAG: hypothetical protein WKF75_03645 [Singulisphaera sp.]
MAPGELAQEAPPLQRGFDHQYGHYGAVIDSFTHERGGVLDWHRNERPLDEPGYSSFLIADEFARVLDAHDPARPFFYYVPFNAVHGPHDARPNTSRSTVAIASTRCSSVWTCPSAGCWPPWTGRESWPTPWWSTSTTTAG